MVVYACGLSSFLISFVNDIAFHILMLYLMMKRFDDSELLDCSLLEMVSCESCTEPGSKCS